MSVSSETSNESTLDLLDISSPFIENGDYFNWELSNHDYNSKIDDSNLDEFYEDYTSFIFENSSKGNYSKNNNIHRSNYEDNLDNLDNLDNVEKTLKQKGKNPSFTEIVHGKI